MKYLWSVPWVFIQVIPILFTFGRCNITFSSDFEIQQIQRFPTYIFFFFSISLNTNIILLEDSFSLLSLYLLRVYDPISWMEKSPRFYRFLKLCNSCLRLLLQTNSFHPPSSTSTGATSKSHAMMFSKLGFLRDKYLEKYFGDLKSKDGGMFDLEWCSSLI